MAWKRVWPSENPDPSVQLRLGPQGRGFQLSSLAPHAISLTPFSRSSSQRASPSQSDSRRLEPARFEKRPSSVPKSCPFNRWSHGEALKLVRLLLVATALILASCSPPGLPAGVDRRDPEAVLHAYFDAWARGDGAAQASLMDARMAANFAGVDPEPIDSIQVLNVQLASTPSATERIYRVVFDIQVKGTGVSMRSGRYDWTYYLTWDAARGSWLISNYGAG